MEDSLESLRRKLALYRGYLAAGLTAEMAQLYLEEIVRLERRLAARQQEPARKARAKRPPFVN